MHIKIKKGLDIPIEGQWKADPHFQVEELSRLPAPQQIGLDLTPFEESKFRLLCKVEDRVKKGEPLLEDKQSPGRYVVSPAGGIIKEIRRGLKRRLLAIVIEVSQREEEVVHAPLDIASASREQIIERLLQGGAFAAIRQRPFNRLANPQKIPRAIFIKAIESAPFVPAAEWQVAGNEKAFQIGLQALAKLAEGSVHLVYRKGSPSLAFTQAQGVHHHTIEGPHPAGNTSVHIHFISPIQQAEDCVWTATALDVVNIGNLIMHGRLHTDRVIGIAGSGILESQRGVFRGRMGYPVVGMTAGRLPKEPLRFISGDVLMGHRVEISDFLGFSHTTLSVVPENTSRQFLHFLRIGADKFTASGTYLSGHLSRSDHVYPFTTSLHGEPRPFIVGEPYDDVMPMNIPTMLLVKAVMAEDYERAEELGLLEVDAEDFALATFVCPSKVEMVEIMREGLRAYAKL